MATKSSSGASPRWATPRTDRPTLGGAVAAAAELLGTPLMPWQRLVADVGLELTDDGLPAYREVIFTTPRQSGKGLGLNTPIPTPDGWTTMGELALGDVLFDETGAQCQVTFVSEDRHLDCYRVAFSDGTDVIADGDHLWAVYDVWGHSNDTKGAWKTLTTREMVGKAKIGNRGKHESRYRLPDVGPLDCPAADLPIDPYVFGAWLGDGHSAAPILTCGADDVDELVTQVETAGYVVKFRDSDKRTGAWSFRFETPDHREWARDEGMVHDLRALGVYGDKHIPDVYLRGSLAQRLALLQGLMDTDGTVGVNGNNRTNRSCEFSVCSEPLARDFLELLRTLGIRSNWKSGPAKIGGRTVGTRYRLQFTTDLPVFRLARKASRHNEQGSLRKRSRTIRDIEPVPTVPTRCIQVDAPSALFRAGTGMVPTHNTTLILGWTIQRAVGWAEILGAPQRITYSAQTGNDARKKLLDDFVQVLRPVQAAAGIARIYKGVGNEQLIWANGSKLDLLASLEDSGHGKTIDLPIKDELFADHDFRRDQAMVPATATRPAAQMLTASTMGTPDSIAWNQKVSAGRAAAEARKDTGIAYFEWSARLDEDPEDPATWWGCMPALGRTIGLPAVEHAFSTHPLGEFKRAFLNQMTTSNEQVIPQLIWEAAQSNILEVTPSVFVLDVNPERTQAGIVAAAPNEIEVVDYRLGVGWCVDRARQLFDKYGVGFAIDGTGPAAGYVAELEREGVPVRVLGAREFVNACGVFYDDIVNERTKVRNDADLDRAVAGATKRVSGDAWAWGRKSSKVDICLLVGATIGNFVAHNPFVSAAPVFAY